MLGSLVIAPISFVCMNAQCLNKYTHTRARFLPHPLPRSATPSPTTISHRMSGLIAKLISLMGVLGANSRRIICICPEFFCYSGLCAYFFPTRTVPAVLPRNKDFVPSCLLLLFGLMRFETLQPTHQNNKNGTLFFCCFFFLLLFVWLDKSNRGLSYEKQKKKFFFDMWKEPTPEE